jgi:hypothetical protein
MHLGTPVTETRLEKSEDCEDQINFETNSYSFFGWEVDYVAFDNYTPA